MHSEGGMTATLADVLELRADDRLTDEEIWSLLIEVVQTLQDFFISGEINRYEIPFLSPNTLCLTSRGKVLIKPINKLTDLESLYLAPEYKGKECKASELEKMWIYSLGKVLLLSWKNLFEKDDHLYAALIFMTKDDPRRRCSLTALLKIILERCKIDLRLTPSSHSVLGLYQEIFGCSIPFQCLSNKVTNSAKDEALFSKRREKDDSKNTTTSLKNRRCESARNPVRRVPSRMYRDLIPGKQCNGPEFVVRDEEPTMVVRLGNSKNTSGTSLLVILLTGEKVEVICEPKAVTCLQVLQLLVGIVRLQDDFMFGLARLVDGDFVFVPHEMKMHKMAGSGWKSGKAGKDTTLLFHMRVMFFWPDLRGLKNWDTKHLIYLQLRRSLLERQVKLNLQDLINLAGLALQAEFGDFSDVDHGLGSYFLPEHYLPEDLLDADVNLEEKLREAHKSRSGLQRNRAEEDLIRRVQSLPDYGCHHYSAVWVQKSNNLSTWVTVNSQGIFLSISDDENRIPCLWKDIDRLCCNKNRFRIDLKSGSSQKTSRYELQMDFNKGSSLLFLASSLHRFHMKLRTESDPLQAASQEFGVRPDRNRIKSLKTVGGENSRRFRKMARAKRITGDSQECFQFQMDDQMERRQNKENENPSNRISRQNESPETENSNVAYIIDSTACSIRYDINDVNDSVLPSLNKNWSDGKSWAGERILKKVHLVRDETGSFGLEVVEGRHGGIYVANVVKESWDEAEDSVRKGDELIAVDGTCILNRNYKESLDILRNAGTKMDVVVSRNCPGTCHAKTQPQSRKSLVGRNGSCRGSF